MFVRLGFIFLLLWGVAYGQNKPYVDPVLREPVNKWITDCNKYHPMGWEIYYIFDSILVDDNMDPNMLGVCEPGRNVILINRNIIADEFLLKLVVYHELGHCILDKRHICDRISIMNPNLQRYDREKYEMYWRVLIVEYFNNVGIRCPALQLIPTF